MPELAEPPTAVSTELQVNVSDNWPFRDFGEDLVAIDDTYVRIGALFLESRAFEAMRLSLTKIEPASKANESRTLEPRFALLLEEARQELPTLTLGEVRIASPGFFSALGDLNPLKVIADFITNWRKENSSRRAADDAARLRDRQLRNQQTAQEQNTKLAAAKLVHEMETSNNEMTLAAMRLAQDIASTMKDSEPAKQLLLERTLKLVGEGPNGAAFLKYALEPAKKELLRLASDSRIETVVVVQAPPTAP